MGREGHHHAIHASTPPKRRSDAAPGCCAQLRLPASSSLSRRCTRVLFLDEPTTGLDSYTANECMMVVQRIAHAGVTVCATIHSPTSFSYSLFDTMMMLVRGQVVYFGPRGEQPHRGWEGCQTGGREARQAASERRRGDSTVADCFCICVSAVPLL